MAKRKKAVRAAPVSVAAPVAVVTAPPMMDMPSPAAEEHAGLSIGAWAYLLGLTVALLAALFVRPGLSYYTYAVLAVLGFMVALLNITDQETVLFLVASIAFILTASSVRTVLDTAPEVAPVLNNIIVFTAASAFLVSLKAIIHVSRNK